MVLVRTFLVLFESMQVKHFVSLLEETVAMTFKAAVALLLVVQLQLAVVARLFSVTLVGLSLILLQLEAVVVAQTGIARIWALLLSAPQEMLDVV